MTRLRFRSWEGRDITPQEWLRTWAEKYPSQRYAKYDDLIAKHRSFSAGDFQEIGRWKDNANTEDKWKPNVASVAYAIWMQAASESPKCPEQSDVAAFLEDWSSRRYEDKNAKRTGQKPFGLSRATTLLHFLSGGRFPIFDSRVRRAMKRLLNQSVPNTIRWYLDSCCPLCSELAALCGAGDLRTLDKALFSYGAKTLSFSN